jgi:riboflavin biosynthesis pyrimidine reductase
MIRSEERRRRRVQRGLAPEPLACIVSAMLRLRPEQVPLLAEPQARVAILTPSERTIAGGCAAQVEYVRCVSEGRLDLGGALAALRGRFGLRTLLCEGGPHLNGHLLEARLVDDLLLSLSPKLAGGHTADDTLRIVAGSEPEQPVEMELVGALEGGDQVFLHYRVRAGSDARS